VGLLHGKMASKEKERIMKEDDGNFKMKKR